MEDWGDFANAFVRPTMSRPEFLELLISAGERLFREEDAVDLTANLDWVKALRLGAGAQISRVFSAFAATTVPRSSSSLDPSYSGRPGGLDTQIQLGRERFRVPRFFESLLLTAYPDRTADDAWRELDSASLRAFIHRESFLEYALRHFDPEWDAAREEIPSWEVAFHPEPGTRGARSFRLVSALPHPRQSAESWKELRNRARDVCRWLGARVSGSQEQRPGHVRVGLSFEEVGEHFVVSDSRGEAARYSMNRSVGWALAVLFQHRGETLLVLDLIERAEGLRLRAAERRPRVEAADFEHSQGRSERAPLDYRDLTGAAAVTRFQSHLRRDLPGTSEWREHWLRFDRVAGTVRMCTELEVRTTRDRS